MEYWHCADISQEWGISTVIWNEFQDFHIKKKNTIQDAENCVIIYVKTVSVCAWVHIQTSA